MLRARQSAFLPEITAVHHTLKCYVYGSIAHVSIEMPHFWKSKFWKKQLPPEFSMEMFYKSKYCSVNSLDS